MHNRCLDPQFIWWLYVINRLGLHRLHVTWDFIQAPSVHIVWLVVWADCAVKTMRQLAFWKAFLMCLSS